MSEKLGRYFDKVMLVMAWLGAIFIMFILFSVSAGAILRYFFHISITWTTELTEYSLLYMTFLMAPWVLKQDRHVRVDILINIIKSINVRALATIEIIGNTLGLVIFGILGYYGVIVTIDNFARHVTNPTVLAFPKAPLLAVIPLSCICLFIQFIRRTYHWAMVLYKGDDMEHPHTEKPPEALVDETV